MLYILSCDVGGSCTIYIALLKLAKQKPRASYKAYFSVVFVFKFFVFFPCQIE